MENMVAPAEGEPVENLLSNGLSTMHNNVPASAVRKLHVRTVITVSLIFASSRSKASDKSLTALVPMPRLVESETNLIVELKSDIKPIPSGPRMRATSFVRTIETNMLSP